MVDHLNLRGLSCNSFLCPTKDQHRVSPFNLSELFKLLAIFWFYKTPLQVWSNSIDMVKWHNSQIVSRFWIILPVSWYITISDGLMNMGGVCTFNIRRISSVPPYVPLHPITINNHRNHTFILLVLKFLRSHFHVWQSFLHWYLSFL